MKGVQHFDPLPEQTEPRTADATHADASSLSIRTRDTASPDGAGSDVSPVSEARKKVVKQESRDGDTEGGIDKAVPATTVIIPTSHQDWEPMKFIIQELYITQNLTLADVVKRMENEHNLRAT